MITRCVAKGVFAISLAWSNAYLLLKGSEAALIDTGLRRDRPALLAALRELGVRVEQIRAVYLTHAHCDHAGNAAYFAAQGAHIHLHENEARFLSCPRRTYAQTGLHMLARPFSALAFLIGEQLYPVARCAVDVCHQDNDTIDAPGGPLRVIACPGHTPGHAAYYRARDGLLFSGDAVLNIIPVRRVTDLSLPMRLFTDDWTAARRSAIWLAQLQPTRLLAGHGHPLLQDTAARLKNWAETLL